MAFAFAVGDRVRKVGGDYEIDGEVRAAFTNSRGAERYVVEHRPGFLHIYSERNLVLRLEPRAGETGERPAPFDPFNVPFFALSGACMNCGAPEGHNGLPCPGLTITGVLR